MKTKLALAILVATGLAAAPFAAEAKSHKKHHSSMSSQTTTGANMKSGTSANPSSQGNVGPGTNQAGSMSTPAK
jgi:ABC-type oligopeptide transport system substrate-binding subunit